MDRYIRVQILKLEILTNLARADNISVLLREFQSYISGGDKGSAAATIQVTKGKSPPPPTLVRDRWSCRRSQVKRKLKTDEEKKEILKKKKGKSVLKEK